MKKFYNHDFYTAIMDEDLGHIEELIKNHGSNFSILVKDRAYENFRKVKIIRKRFYRLYQISHGQKKCHIFS